MGGGSEGGGGGATIDSRSGTSPPTCGAVRRSWTSSPLWMWGGESETQTSVRKTLRAKRRSRNSGSEMEEKRSGGKRPKSWAPRLRSDAIPPSWPLWK